MVFPPKHILSKSTFMRGCQCTKSLWLHKFKPELKDELEEAQSAIFQQGTDVGMLARQLFPGGVDASPATPFEYQQSVADTARYISDGETVIYEAAFQYDGVLAAIDILVKKKNKWYAYEVKGSTKVKDVFVQDAALQYFVITHAGLALEDICLVHLNNTYIRNGELDMECLFSKPSIKKEILVLQTFIAKKLAELKIVSLLKQMPAIAIGPHCSNPYTCDFTGFCYKDIEYEDPDYGKASIDRPALQQFVKSLKYPLHFLDFETYMTAVPAYDGHWSYRQIVFQYSLHIQKKAGAAIEHAYYLAEHVGTPMETLLKQLLKDIGNSGSVIVYNQGFENTRLNELKRQYPAYSKKIESLQNRMIDLMVPFRKKQYYTPAMQGRYSIKNVLPALVPELGYEGLEISNGTDASTAFYNLQHETDPVAIEAIWKQLLEYCKMDTWGMVKVLEKLREVGDDKVAGRIIRK